MIPCREMQRCCAKSSRRDTEHEDEYVKIAGIEVQ
jgi:hypothetical protein